MTDSISKKIAVIGSGISGISSAWFLGQRHQVTLFEKNARLGGHTHTHTLNINNQPIEVDTGFIVFNRPNYPLLSALFRHLDINTQPTEMSFSVSVNQGALEYSGNNLNTLFAQRSNLLSAAHWKMIRDIMRFNQQAKSDLKNQKTLELSLGDYLKLHGFGERMIQYYLLPMAAAIWSCPLATMMEFPVGSFLQFFENHGLLNIEDRPQWESVKQGSHQYLKAITKLNAFETRLSSGVTSIQHSANGIRLMTETGLTELFDDVVFACHGDETWQILKNSASETNLAFKQTFEYATEFAPLQHFHYQKNIAYLHRDLALMPKRKLAWASWNYLRTELNAPDIKATSAIEQSLPSENQPVLSDDVAVSYWMNLLQKLPTDEQIFVTLNPPYPPDASKTFERIVYQHPVFDQAAVSAQSALPNLQGRHNLWFCGSYFGYGFHEDGLHSAVELARLWKISLPWETSELTDIYHERTLKSDSEASQITCTDNSEVRYG